MSKQSLRQSRKVEFTVYGEPVGKGRPRFYNGHAVTPEKTRAYEQEVALLSRVATREVFTEAVSVEITAYFGIPKSATKKKRQELIGGYVTKKPDADNIAKIIMDGISGICYKDDSQVALVNIRKIYTADEPRVTVKIGTIESASVDDGKSIDDVAKVALSP